MINRICLYLLCVFNGCFIYAQSSIKQQIIRKNAAIYLVDNKREYPLDMRTVTIKPKNISKQLDFNIKVIRSNRLGFLDITVPDSIDIESYVKLLSETESCETIEYNAIGTYCYTPNDLFAGNQWYHNIINIHDVWDLTIGSSFIKIAVIDSGVDTNHEDLGIGTDGYTNLEISNGWNYVSNNNNVVTNNFHGTAVSGIIAAKTGNGKGIAGIAGGNSSSGIRVIPYCVGISSPETSYIDDAIIDAVDKGVKVINMSLTIPENSAINSAIEYAYNNGVAIVCASGNEDNSSIPYPASNVKTIAVGAIDQLGQRANFSNYGQSLDITAPGVNIYSTQLNNIYDYSSGTSFSAPQITGVIALMLSVNPNLSLSNIYDILTNTANKLTGYTYNSSGWNNEVGYGVVDAFGAVTTACINSVTLSGPTTINTNTVYTLNNFPALFSVTWSINNSAFTLSTTGNNCVVSYNQGQQYDSAILTASILLNGIVIKTIAKQITHIGEIEGNSVLCTSGIYNTISFPDSLFVTWSIDNTAFSLNTLGNQCIVSCNNYSQSREACLTASVSNNSGLVAILTKNIYTHGIGLTISGTQEEYVSINGYYPEQTFSYNITNAGSGFSSSNIIVNADCDIVLESERFQGMEISFEGNGAPTNVQHNGSIISFHTQPYSIDFEPLQRFIIDDGAPIKPSSYPFTMQLRDNEGCSDFDLNFTVKSIPFLNDTELQISTSSTTLYVHLMTAGGTPVGGGLFQQDTWYLSVINAATGQTVTSKTVTGQTLLLTLVAIVLDYIL